MNVVSIEDWSHAIVELKSSADRCPDVNFLILADWLRTSYWPHYERKTWGRGSN